MIITGNAVYCINYLEAYLERNLLCKVPFDFIMMGEPSIPPPMQRTKPLHTIQILINIENAG